MAHRLWRNSHPPSDQLPPGWHAQCLGTGMFGPSAASHTTDQQLAAPANKLSLAAAAPQQEWQLFDSWPIPNMLHGDAERTHGIPMVHWLAGSGALPQLHASWPGAVLNGAPWMVNMWRSEQVVPAWPLLSPRYTQFIYFSSNKYRSYL